MNGLLDRVVLVTGGGSGIGAGVAEVFAGFGARVAVADIAIDKAVHVAEEVSKLDHTSTNAIGVAMDVTDRDSIDRAVVGIEDQLGPISVLVNNAGVSLAQPFTTITDIDLDKILSVNLLGVFRVTQRVLPGMIERGDGRVVNISSMAGKEGLPGLAHYCASKFGVIGMTQSLAKEVAPSGVTVNAVCPGVVRTPLWDDPETGILNQMAAGAWEEFLSGIPLGRPQSAHDIGYACAYLASDYASNITGEAVNVSGGQQMH